MSSNSIDSIVYCEGSAGNTTLVVVGDKTAEESRDPFHSEDLVLVVDLSDLGHFEVVPPVLIFY